MSDYYHHFLSSMAGVGGQPEATSPDGLQPMHHHPAMSADASPMSNPYQSLGYFTGFPEPIMFNAPKAQRSRRKSAPGLDHIKHRRTRSGCYTCRSRRVKVTRTLFDLAKPLSNELCSATRIIPRVKVGRIPIHEAKGSTDDS